MIATAIVPAANADSQTVNSVSAAHGHGLSVALAGAELAGSATATTQWSKSGNTGPKTGDLDLSVLGGKLIEVPGGLQIPLISEPGKAGLLDLGDLGVLKGYANSPYQSASEGSSGILGEDGGVILSPENVPAGFKPAKLDVSALIEQVLGANARQTLLSDAGVEIGALGATAKATRGAQEPATDYMVAGAKLKLKSPLVGELGTTLTDTLTGVGGTLNNALGTSGAIGSVVAGLPDINIGLLRLNLGGGTAGIDGLDAAIAEASNTLLAEPLADGNGIVNIKLNEGTIEVDLSKVVAGGDLNNLPANTALLDDATIAKITAAVTEAVGTLTAKVTSVVNSLVENLSVTIKLPVQLSVVGLAAADEVITIDAKISQLLGKDTTAPTIAITNNNPSLIGSILRLLGVNDLLTFITKDVLGGVTGALKPVVQDLLDLIGTNLTSTLNPAVSELLSGLSPVFDGLNEILAITINEQPRKAPLNQTGGDLGAGSTTVRALAVTLLPGDPALARVELASASAKHKFDAPDPGNANTRAAASASASAQADAKGGADVQGAALAAAMADNSTEASAATTADAKAAAKSAAYTDASTNASATSTSTANASSTAAANGGTADSTANSKASASASANGTAGASASSKASSSSNAYTAASANASANASSTSTASATSTSTSTSTSNASASTDPTGSTTASASTKANANVNASASAAADAKGNAAAKAAALADATTQASAKATANTQAAAKAAATTTASTNASTTATTTTSAQAAAQAAAHSKNDSDSNAAATAKANSNASAAAKAAANTTASANASADANGGTDPEVPEYCPFIDVKGHKFERPSNWMCENYLSFGVEVPGTDKRKYYPDNFTNRGAMAAFIYRMQDGEKDFKSGAFKLPAKPTYGDVSETHTFYKPIEWMAWKGYAMTGGVNSNYNPGTNTSRGAMAAFIYRIEQGAKDPKFKVPSKPTFVDTPTKHTFYKPIEWMAWKKLTVGVETKHGLGYVPKAGTSRGAMAAFLQRLDRSKQ